MSFPEHPQGVCRAPRAAAGSRCPVLAEKMRYSRRGSSTHAGFSALKNKIPAGSILQSTSWVYHCKLFHLSVWAAPWCIHLQSLMLDKMCIKSIFFLWPLDTAINTFYRPVNPFKNIFSLFCAILCCSEKPFLPLYWVLHLQVLLESSLEIWLPLKVAKIGQNVCFRGSGFQWVLRETRAPQYEPFSLGNLNSTAESLPNLQPRSFTKSVIYLKNVPRGCKMSIKTLLSTGVPCARKTIPCSQSREKWKFWETMGCQPCSIGAFHCLPTEHFQKNLEPRTSLGSSSCLICIFF